MKPPHRQGSDRRKSTRTAGFDASSDRREPIAGHARRPAPRGLSAITARRRGSPIVKASEETNLNTRPHHLGGDRLDRRIPDGGGDARRSLPPLSIAIAPDRAGAPGLVTRDRHVLGAGAVHLYVHLDGQVRRRLWRAHRHPCRRGRAGQAAAAGGARQESDPLRPALRRAFHRRGRHVRRRACLGFSADRTGLGGPGGADVDRLSSRFPAAPT